MSNANFFKTLRIDPKETAYLDRQTASSGNIAYDKQEITLRVFDGTVKGGHALARADLENVAVSDYRSKSVDSKLASVIYTVTIVGPQGGDVGNKYMLNGVYRPIPNFVVGYTYVFNQDDATNVYFPNAIGTTLNPHPLNFSADNISGERGGGTSYLTDVQYSLNGAAVTQAVYNSTAFNTATSRQVRITVSNSTPATLYYWCYNHVLMGNSISVADPGSGGSLTAGLGISIIEIDGVSTVSNNGIVSLSAGIGISIDDDSTAKIITNDGVLGIVAGTGITTTVNQGFVTINSVATTGNVTFSGRTIDSDDSTAITFTPSVIFDSDIEVYELVFPDGSRQVSAAGPTPGPQGEQGPPGLSGAGTGDVLSSGGGYVDNAIIRYDGTSGNLIQVSAASISDAGLLTAIAFSGNGAAVTALNAANLDTGTVPVLRLGTAGTRDVTTFLRGDNTWAVPAGGSASDSFATIAVAGQSNVVADSATDTLTLVAGTNITITTNAGTDTITINSTAGGAASDSFATIAVAGQSNVVADSSADVLTLVAGTGINITTNAGTDAITIASTVSGGATAFTGLSDRSDLTVDQFYLPAITRLNVTANGTSAYRFDQYGTADNPTIYAISGTTIAFNLSGANTHPFLIRFAGSNYDTGLVHVTTAGVVTTGSAAQGKQSGTLYWKLPHNISGTYGYLCQSHGGMNGTITVKDIAVI